MNGRRENNMLIVHYPITLAYRNVPVGCIAGISMGGNLLFHDTAKSMMYTSYEEFVDAIHERQRRTRNSRTLVLENLMMVIPRYIDTSVMQWNSSIKCHDVLHRHSRNTELIFFAHRMIIPPRTYLWGSTHGMFKEYRGDLDPPESERSVVVMLPEPLDLDDHSELIYSDEIMYMPQDASFAARMIHESRNTVAGNHVVAFDSSSDDLSSSEDDDVQAVDSDASTVILAEDNDDMANAFRVHAEDVPLEMRDVPVRRRLRSVSHRPPPTECSICCCPLEKAVYSTCGCYDHVMCEQCVTRHATNWQAHSLSALNPDHVLCPHDGCDGTFDFEFLSTLLTASDMEKLMDLQKRYQKCGYVRCPNPKCCAPAMHYERKSPSEFVWFYEFEFELKKALSVDDFIVKGTKPIIISKGEDHGFPANSIYLKFDTDNPSHSIHCKVHGQHTPMRVLTETVPGKRVIECERCSQTFCYHCLRSCSPNMGADDVCSCQFYREDRKPLSGEFNRWFVRKEKREDAPVLYRNYELTVDVCMAQLERMCEGESVAVHCPGCDAALHKTGACNEMTHCGFKTCFICGISSLEGEKNLIDHYHRDGEGCPLWDNDKDWIRELRLPSPAVPRCKEGECYSDLHDCCCPEHELYRSCVTRARRKRMFTAALGSLPPKLLHQIIQAIFFHGSCTLKGLLEEFYEELFYRYFLPRIHFA